MNPHPHSRIIRLEDDFTRWDELLALIQSAFAFMNGIIDPPSSALHLTPAALAEKARLETGLVAMEGERLLGCVFLRPEKDCLYLGKLAVAPDAQGNGIGRRLVVAAETVATSLGLAALRLGTRIELTGNHAFFSSCGFTRTAESAHPGYTRTTQIEMRKVLTGDPFIPAGR